MPVTKNMQSDDLVVKRKVYMNLVYGAINEKGESYHTQMSRVFLAINNKQMEYNWLITDMADGGPPTIRDEYEKNHYCWLTGERLSKIVQEEDVLWAWAVLSGFEKNISLSEVLQYPRPGADGYRVFWKNPVSIQHPLATVEIVAFDSAFTLFISRNEALVKDFLKFFPLSEDLSIYNSRFENV